MLNISKNSIGRLNRIAGGKVSIIITNYKKELFLKKAILSCLNQSYKDIEIIVVDDCSNKGKSLNIVKKIGSNKVRYIYTSRNYGHYACCNYAIDQSTGKYITFLGGDDTVSRDHIKHLLIALEKYRLAAVCSLYSRYYENGKRVGRGGKLCEASIMFQKKRFLRNIGYFHMVRCAADTEYRERAIKYYGGNKFGVLKSDSYKALYLSGSLTRSKKTGRGSSGRSRYAKWFYKNIRRSKPNSLYFNYIKDVAKFSFPKGIRVNNFDSKTFEEVSL